ncbi:hypothetical protein BDW59DRAFT_165554 [Aspergillus cavernicola]|uniref:Uncharacterized protein n=1 Tax=Aspergillus cavernicola TaxID=176166 RepID=A0ABR4HS84_9EURO
MPNTNRLKGRNPNVTKLILIKHGGILFNCLAHAAVQLADGFERALDPCCVDVYNGSVVVAIGFIDQAYGLFLLIIGLLKSLVAPIPQIYLMVARSRANLDKGSLSILGLGFQIIAFTVLAVSQDFRMDWVSTAEGSDYIGLPWSMFFFYTGLGAG